MLLRSIVLCCCLAPAACSPGGDGAAASPMVTAAPSSTTTTATSTTTTTTTTSTTTMAPRFALRGRVVTGGGEGLRGVTVTVGDNVVMTGDDGGFDFAAIEVAPIEMARPAYHSVVLEWDGTDEVLEVTLEPIVRRAIRAAAGVVEDDDRFQALIDLAAATAVNALVFDTKKEGGGVLYDTAVTEAHAIGAVTDLYDPRRRIEQAREAGLYTITRIVSFEDPIRVAARPEYKLAGAWVDMTNPETWEYPLALAVEACEFGFDEVQFDYVRFPTGRSAVQSARNRPTEAEERVAVIAEFLTQARDRLHPMGCAVAADVFAIVLSAANDQGIGQRPEDLSGIVDVLSPMIYPSHYSDGWLGFADPNDYPGEVTAGALDDGLRRVGNGTIVRPWLQAFSWTDGEILESIGEAESRGLGWMLWHSAGRYDETSLPGITGDSSG